MEKNLELDAFWCSSESGLDLPSPAGSLGPRKLLEIELFSEEEWITLTTCKLGAC